MVHTRIKNPNLEKIGAKFNSEVGPNKLIKKSTLQRDQRA